MNRSRWIALALTTSTLAWPGCAAPPESGDPPVGEAQQRWDTESVWDETQSTHLWIVNRALDILARHGTPQDPDYQAVNTYRSVLMTTACRDLWQQGLYDADYLAQYDDGGSLCGSPPLVCGWKSHFYDPTTGLNYRGESDPTALTESNRHFFNAFNYAVDGNWTHANAPSCAGNASGQNGCTTSACYELGLALHYMTDATQPMHASNYTAVNDPAGYHSDYESYVMRIHAQFPCDDWDGSCGAANAGAPVGVKSPDEIVHTAATYARQFAHPLVDAANAQCSGRSCCASPFDAYENNTCWQTPGDALYVGPTTGLALENAQQAAAQYLWYWFHMLAAQGPNTLWLGGAATALAVSGDNYYYADDSGSVKQAFLDRRAPVVLASGVGDVVKLATRGPLLYWATSAGTVGSLDTRTSTPRFVPMDQPQPQPVGLVADATGVYVAGKANGSVVRLDGGKAPTTLTSGEYGITGLAVDAYNVYYTANNGSYGLLRKVPKGGGLPVTVAYTSGGNYTSIAADGASIYWTDANAGTVSRLPINANASTAPQILAAGQSVPSNVAVGDTFVYWSTSNNLDGSLYPGVHQLMMAPRLGGNAIAMTEATVSRSYVGAVAVGQTSFAWTFSDDTAPLSTLWLAPYVAHQNKPVFAGGTVWPANSTWDWDPGYYKGQCGAGEAAIALSKYTGQSTSHALLCEQLDAPARYEQATCRRLTFNTSDSSTWDWDGGFYKGECGANEYVAGVSQTTDGRAHALLCCQGAVAHDDCTPHVLDGGAAGMESSFTGDWDPGSYDKGSCGPGRYLAGVSQSPYSGWGKPHAVLCCSP